jgi:hypothetical protein
MEVLLANVGLAFALYRALLSQCAKLPIEPISIDGLRNAIRNRFRIARPQRLRLALAFRSGYSALDLLDASVAGDDASTARIQDLVQQMPDALKQPPPPPKHLTPKEKNYDHCPPPEQFKLENMFPRPLGSVEGTRKVPFLVNAAGLPFIRWKKPQPENVSRVLKTKLAVRQRRLDEMDAVESKLAPMAEREDEWDRIVGQLNDIEKGMENLVERPFSFAGEVKAYEHGLRTAFAMADEKSVQMGKRFTAIVLKEKEFAQRERAERKALRKARWLERTKGEKDAST